MLAFADLKFAVTTKSSTTMNADVDASQNNALMVSDGARTFATASVLNLHEAAATTDSGLTTFANVFVKSQFLQIAQVKTNTGLTSTALVSADQQMKLYQQINTGTLTVANLNV